MTRSPVRSAVFFAAGLVASLHIRNYRQRCEAFWLARNGVPAEEIQRRLDLSYHLRIVWGYWYMCIYFPFVLGGIAAGFGFALKGVTQAVGIQQAYCSFGPGQCRPAPVVWPALGLAVSLLVARATWRGLARIHGVVSAGIPGYGDRKWPRVPSWEEMGEGMPAEWHDPYTLRFSKVTWLVLLVVPHLITAVSIVMGVVSAFAPVAAS